MDLILPYCVLQFILVCVLVCCVARSFQDSINSTELDYFPTQLICAPEIRVPTHPLQIEILTPGSVKQRRIRVSGNRCEIGTIRILRGENEGQTEGQ